LDINPFCASSEIIFLGNLKTLPFGIVLAIYLSKTKLVHFFARKIARRAGRHRPD
jgi:hypothetical protein